jgi:hypothetical protein
VVSQRLALRWYYEVELGNDGVVQVGWAGADFGADDGAGDGVGDDAHSWGFDGCRGRAWTAGAAEAYGGAEGWKKGDVVGCRVDVDKGEASFSVNGADLGVAFRGVAGPLSAALRLDGAAEPARTVGTAPQKAPVPARGGVFARHIFASDPHTARFFKQL